MNTNLIQWNLLSSFFNIHPDTAFGQLPPRSPKILALLTFVLLVGFAASVARSAPAGGDDRTPVAGEVFSQSR
jgi:hypothetical protein